MKRSKITKLSTVGASVMSAAVAMMFDPDLAKFVLNETWKSTMVQALVVVMVVYFFMGRKIADGLRKAKDDTLKEFANHFDRMEVAVQKIAVELVALKDTVSKDLSSHSKMIGDIGTEVSNLKTRVEALEKPKGGLNA